jgi:hypothetical protein
MLKIQSCYPTFGSSSIDEFDSSVVNLTPDEAIEKLNFIINNNQNTIPLDTDFQLIEFSEICKTISQANNEKKLTTEQRQALAIALKPLQRDLIEAIEADTPSNYQHGLKLLRTCLPPDDLQMALIPRQPKLGLATELLPRFQFGESIKEIARGEVTLAPLSEKAKLHAQEVVRKNLKAPDDVIGIDELPPEDMTQHAHEGRAIFAYRNHKYDLAAKEFKLDIDMTYAKYGTAIEAGIVDIQIYAGYSCLLSGDQNMVGNNRYSASQEYAVRAINGSGLGESFSAEVTAPAFLLADSLILDGKVEQGIAILQKMAGTSIDLGGQQRLPEGVVITGQIRAQELLKKLKFDQ